jgi:hypothetical protein
MDIKISTKQILKFLNVISWIIFLGLCIEAGGIIFNTFFTHFINQDAANHFWKEINFSALYNFDQGYFLVIVTLMSIVAIIKALMFYQIVKTLNYKKLNLSEPFSNELRKVIINIAYIVLAIGLFSIWGINYTQWLVSKNISMPTAIQMGFGGADVWLFMSVILFVIAQIFKRGIELQEENDLTI